MSQIDFKTRQKTVWIVGIVIVALVGWDVYAAFLTDGAGDTISEVVLGFDRRFPVIRFLAGVLCGHLFWPQVVKEKI